MEKKQIKIVYDWLKPQSIRDIQVFLGFANFYQQFIQEFSRFATLFISILKIILAAGLVASIKVGDKKQNGEKIKVEN